jgi:LCP family protein required for cell wall assembly
MTVPAPPVRRRRWPRRLLLGLNIVVGLCLLGTGSLYAYVRYRLGQVHRVTIAGLTFDTSSGSSLAPMNILVVGSDTRATLSGGGAQFGGSDVGGARSDTIMLVHLNPSAGTASLLSIPRDLWVDIPGMGKQRINAAFNNGPDLLVRTIQDDLGIPINHFVDVDFDSFRQVVNAMGGVKFWYPEPVRDNDNGVNDSGLNITTPGCYTLDGNMALSLVRTRHMQYEDNGSWIFEAQSDLARIRRQQLFVKKVINKAEGEGLGNITTINGVIGGVVSNLTVDRGFSEATMIALVRRYRHFDPGSLSTATLPTTGTVIGGGDVLLLQQQPAQAVIDLWQGTPSSTSYATTTTTAASPATSHSLAVGVENGSGAPHQASQAVSALRTAGYNASIEGSGSASNFGYSSNVVEYSPEDAAAAQLLAAQVGGQLRLDSTLNPGNVIVITGANYSGVHQVAPGSLPPLPTTTTTTTPAAQSALNAVPGNSSDAPAFPGPHGQDPAPPGSGC